MLAWVCVCVLCISVSNSSATLCERAGARLAWCRLDPRKLRPSDLLLRS